jgi:uroporphyrinogen decarboxylase
MMEPERLKADYGDKISFWGGINVQQVLPRGTINEAKAEVKRVISILEKGGGFILSPAHCIQYDVPAENMKALYEATHEYYE